MLFSQDRNEIRKFYIESWQKFINKQIMTPIEQQIARIIEFHPEYHEMFKIDNMDKDYSVESGQINPFLHIGLHLAVVEQYQTNRPSGIRNIYEQFVKKYNGDEHKVHHTIIDYLAETIWQSQKYNQVPDDKKYILNLTNKLNSL